MFKSVFLIFVVLFSASSFAEIKNKAIENPDDFLKRIYASYDNDGTSSLPLDDTGPKQIISDRFMAVLQKNQELTPPGDVGYLDADPICQCQDYQNLVVNNINIISNNNKNAKAQVTFRPFKQSDTTITTTFYLVVENGRWFIDDLFGSDNKSVRNAVAEDNQVMLQEKGKSAW